MTIHAGNYNIEFGKEAYLILSHHLKIKPYSSIHVLTDTHTATLCLPRLKNKLPNINTHINITAGETNKNLFSCRHVWDHLSSSTADRNTLLINLGGGMICDLGGFAASTYKRGIDFIHIPTSLLGMVDASVGAKTGIDYLGYKNQIGTFTEPVMVLIDEKYLKTLPERELLAGFAEVIKHCLLEGESALRHLLEFEELPKSWSEIIRSSVSFKLDIVRSDPRESGYRKALNFGHTFGHALESHSLTNTHHLLHGEAVAIGMLMELAAGVKAGITDKKLLIKVSDFIRLHYAHILLPRDWEKCIRPYLQQDKKNSNSKILAVMLEKPGKAIINSELKEDQIKFAIQWLKEFWH